MPNRPDAVNSSRYRKHVLERNLDFVHSLFLARAYMFSMNYVPGDYYPRDRQVTEMLRLETLR